MSIKYAVIAAAMIGVGVPTASFAQGLVGGAAQGADAGAAAAGPVGAVVGGAVGAATGTVNGVLGVGPTVAPCGTRTTRRENAEGDSETTQTSNCR